MHADGRITGKMRNFSKAFADEIRKRKLKDKDKINCLKIGLLKRFGIKEIPSNADVLVSLGKPDEETRNLLLQKPVRSASGIAVVALMVKPHECPGNCIYCPSGIEKEMPKSYTGFEPAAMRALQFNFDPKKQIRNRIEQLDEMGHFTEKIELIIMGGCFLSMQKAYQNSFVKSCLGEISGSKAENLAQAKLIAEKGKRRIVGLTIETRPDFCRKGHVERILDLGGTRVELGVQMPSDEVYEKVKRGHTVGDVVDATRFAKDSALKVCYHIMPGIYGIPLKKQLSLLKNMFVDEDFKPDMLKIYPCLVMKGTKLHRLWENGKYEPLGNEEAAEFIAELKRDLPEWVRVMRVQRDIPANLIAAGVKKSNLRQLVGEKMKEKGIECRCIRHREIGIREMKNKEKSKSLKLDLKVIDYRASKGKEYFIEAVDEDDSLYGFLRLRIPHEPFMHGLDEETALIRELHVYGTSLPLGIKKEDAVQHKGLGKVLMERAEEIAKGDGMKKSVVISALGVKEYYRKFFGYRKKGVYMGKRL